MTSLLRLSLAEREEISACTIQREAGWFLLELHKSYASKTAIAESSHPLFLQVEGLAILLEIWVALRSEDRSIRCFPYQGQA